MDVYFEDRRHDQVIQWGDNLDIKKVYEIFIQIYVDKISNSADVVTNCTRFDQKTSV